MTNPNDAVGTNGAFGGRTSVNAFNDIMGAFQSRGVLSGWGIVPSSGMTVAIGGSGTTRDVAVAEDASGNKTSVNNISGAPISVTLDSAPASNSRYDAIVAYVDKPPIGNATQDNPECCGIIPVTGTAASTPAYPDDAAIRSAITADGASGATAYYVVLGYVLVASGTTTITSGMITAGLSPTTNAMLDTAHIQDGAVTASKIDWSTFDTGWVNCTYESGWKIGSNAGAAQLKARVLAGVLYMCGGVSQDTGSTININVEYTISKLPASILQAWRDGYSGQTMNAVGMSRASGGRDTTWVIPGSVEAGKEGDIIMRVNAAQNVQTINITWVQAPVCFGLCPRS